MTCRLFQFVRHFSLILIASSLHAQTIELSQPIFKTGVPNSTQDKPQSKLWFAHQRYWAWLPIKNGSTVLEQTSDGWRELTHLKEFLSGMPGQADVWADDLVARAVLVGADQLAVVELRFDRDRNTYVPADLKQQFSLPLLDDTGDKLETATIARDSNRRWWISFDRDQKICVLNTTDSGGLSWGQVQIVGSNTHRDDISSVYALNDRIGVVWSDQVSDAVYLREHLDNRPPDEWGPAIVVEQGNKTADDHLNGVVADDGSLYLTTKNSVDAVGKPQLILRIRRPDGRWENHPYAILQEKLGPSRPIVQLAGPSQDLILLHTNYDRRDPLNRKDYIAAIRSIRQPLDLARPERPVLTAAKSINNVTGVKRPVPPSVPVIVLASDSDGNVYSAQVSGLANQ
jgi:hypothetical protein